MMAQTERWKRSRVKYNSATGVYHIPHESSESLSTNIVLSVAALEGVRPTQLPPLAETVDPDAIDTIFSEADDATLSFSYAGYRIELDSDRTIEIVPLVGVPPRRRN